MLRGNERKCIFYDDEDRTKFLDILFNKKLISEYKLYAYCLMANHIHLLMKENKEDIAVCLKRINISYAYYFNKKYARVGHLFQDRFRSECIDNDQYMLSALRYIHNNPVKSKISAKPDTYTWSSYNDYIGIMNNDSPVDCYEILSLFSSNIKNAIKLFVNFSNQISNENFIDYKEDDNRTIIIKSLSSAKSYVKCYLDNLGIGLENIKDMHNINHRNNLIIYLRRNSNLSIREISSILNIDRNMVGKIEKSQGTVP
jgi:Transposase and inactivated derivatives